MRLDAVRAALRDGGPGSTGIGPTITALAAAHGLTHAGKFARDYKRRFGEAPSATRRRGR
jgi:AraC-like DNA-binding protein